MCEMSALALRWQVRKNTAYMSRIRAENHLILVDSLDRMLNAELNSLMLLRA